MLTERVVEGQIGSDYKPPKIKKGGLSMHCASCGKTVELALWQPVVRCPHCAKLVYPDRSLRNLLPLGWNCLECGTLNDSLTNFCAFCGVGLATRCLACEAPVTGPICLRCGEHQAHLRHLKQRGVARASWVPIQRERIQHQVERVAEKERKELEAQAAAAAKVATPPPAQPLSEKEARRQARRERRERRKQRGQSWGGGWWIWMIVLGGYFMANRMGASFGDIFKAPETPPTPVAMPAWAADGAVTFEEWLSALIPALNRVPELSPSDPEYAAVFAAVLLGIAALPMLVFLVNRFAKRLVP